MQEAKDKGTKNIVLSSSGIYKWGARHARRRNREEKKEVTKETE